MNYLKYVWREINISIDRDPFPIIAWGYVTGLFVSVILAAFFDTKVFIGLYLCGGLMFGCYLVAHYSILKPAWNKYQRDKKRLKDND